MSTLSVVTDVNKKLKRARGKWRTHVDAAARGQQRSWQQSGSCGGNMTVDCHVSFSSHFDTFLPGCHVYFSTHFFLLFYFFPSCHVSMHFYIFMSCWYFLVIFRDCQVHIPVHITFCCISNMIGLIPACLGNISQEGSVTATALKFCKGDFPQLSCIL